MKTFQDYLDDLKLEAERGSSPNYKIPIEKFIGVADNISSRIQEVKPVESMSYVIFFIVQITRF